ncbi:formate--tetrahydrofolate ligase [Flammeovirga yaeyamensis]|uniref:Formate--tetrahydrofolate ligase n=1 Tax=Flammeovirga yaeyamensis TaxID=367791 RepID=A0AAX1N1G2_9BACT|nr:MULTISPECIES: formate--tetrahydrofolate ligase [Flammeovirga]ANQ51265.1 formate--tetrahydrofolate ligase [Flammeovirga sp. MY04]MBB3698320.1 formate--tetrahydrofolate ligase [Flammeovirga yaeyamensis]NMF34327.1 formate--tetrahydrofolate ligase [Flammeovirga yaeyamensis]QWG01309.1 formate--tetrahydrofolate ligase [Flammeovirga yaeyamensis]
MKTDIQIARETELKKIREIAASVGISEDDLIPYGHYMAKLPYDVIDEKKASNSKLILVTAITPTRAGIGKTTTSVGLALGLQELGKNAIPALREPSLGVCFGLKGGAAGGGYAQVLPMEDINLHFTGDFHAVTSANNMISALVDNHQHFNRAEGKQLKNVLWRRVLDVNDRSLRSVVTGLGGFVNGKVSEAGFDITPASELMAILCLAKDREDLQKRVGDIYLGYDYQNEPVYVRDLGIEGAIAVLMKDAIHPNLVQTTENTPAFVHGGPFANIAHGCNSVLATKMCMNYADYTITEAGFGADLGAEKFFNIKCRNAGLNPALTVIVATSQALKLHGGVELEDIKEPNLEGLKAGLPNLKRHIENMKNFGQTVMVTFNQYAFDTKEEMDFVAGWCKEQGVEFAVNNSFVEGGKGATELAQKVVDLVETNPSKPLEFTYDLEDCIETKLEKIAKKVYRADGIKLDNKARLQLKRIKRYGLDHLPVCVAKTQSSFTDDAKVLNAPEGGYDIHFEDLIINSGAGFIVARAGSIMRMPGLPKVPQANKIKFVDGEIEGLS